MRWVHSHAQIADGLTKATSKPCGAFVIFKKEMEGLKKGKFTRAMQAQWMQTLSSRWRALPDARTGVFVRAARWALLRRTL